MSFHYQPPAKRYWPNSWEMSCWRSLCCDRLLRARNPFTRFWARFFVAPLTNVTGLSLYYQLYLVEIFHIRFLTKLGHYIFMVQYVFNRTFKINIKLNKIQQFTFSHVSDLHVTLFAIFLEKYVTFYMERFLLFLHKNQSLLTENSYALSQPNKIIL